MSAATHSIVLFIMALPLTAADEASALQSAYIIMPYYAENVNSFLSEAAVVRGAEQSQYLQPR